MKHNVMRNCIIFIVLLASVFTLSSCGKDDAAKFEWTDIEMYEVLPVPENLYGEIRYNTKTSLILTLGKIDEKAFKAYRDKCIDTGYTIDPDESDISYSAHNADGYFLHLLFYKSNQKLSVDLDAPEEMSEFEWPTIGLATILPAPKSTLGDVTTDNSEMFIVRVGNTPIEDYKEYVKACEDASFTVNYTREDNYYSAENTDGYKLRLKYLGFNKIEIVLEAPEDGTSSPPANESKLDTAKPVTTEPVIAENEPKNNNISNDAELRPGFKAAMDGYEVFMDEYVEIIIKFNENPYDPSILTDYTTYVSKYAEVVEDFNKWGYEDMNTAEIAYYLEVQNRLTQKMIEVSDYLNQQLK